MHCSMPVASVSCAFVIVSVNEVARRKSCLGLNMAPAATYFGTMLSIFNTLDIVQ